MTANQSQGRVLGLDVGESRVGVAISDPDGRLAVPMRVIQRGGAHGAIDVLRQILEQDSPAEIVVGLPLTMSGARGEQAARTEAFASELEQALNVPVRFWDERLSTAEANRSARPASRRRRGAAKRSDAGNNEDALAAAIILQAYLDSKRRIVGYGP